MFAVRITEFYSQLPTSLQAKMVQRGKQGRVGARQGFSCNSVKLGLLVNINMYEVDSNTFFLIFKAIYPSKIVPCPYLYIFDTHLQLSSVVLGPKPKVSKIALVMEMSHTTRIVKFNFSSYCVGLFLKNRLKHCNICKS